MHRRQLNGKTLKFGHTGKLYKNSFVMYDKGTRSEWIHVTGECAKGKFIGKKLPFIRSMVLTWGQWKKRFPKTLVLPGRPRGGFMGTFVGVVRRDGLGFHIRIGIKSKLYAYRDIERTHLVEDEFEKTPLLVVFDKKAKTATAWDRRVDGEVLKFEMTVSKKNQILKDKGSGSQWDLLTGECLDGLKKGKAMKPIIGIPIRLDRWRGFYPRGEVFRKR